MTKSTASPPPLMSFEGSSMSSNRRNRRRSKKASFTVQGLYDVCKDVFAECGPGIVPSPENVRRLSSYLGNSKFISEV
jgi:plant cysteine oxidase